MKLKELLLQIYETQTERLPDESDEDYLTRIGNEPYEPIGDINQRSNLPNVIKTNVVIPKPIKKK